MELFIKDINNWDTKTVPVTDRNVSIHNDKNAYGINNRAFLNLLKFSGGCLMEKLWTKI